MTERERIAWDRLNNLVVARCVLQLGQYSNGRPALQAFTNEGEPYCTVTVNLVDRMVGEGEFFVKCELRECGGAALLQGLVDAAIAYPTGVTVGEGWSERYAEVWRLTWPT
jgi:hypothetical protein